MKTLSVKQVADILGISPRAIHKRLASGTLKGTRRSNKFGVDEWWIYPNKEIRNALEIAGQIDILGPLPEGHDVALADIADAETVDVSRSEHEGFEKDDRTESHVGNSNRIAAEQVAEDLWSNLIERFMSKIEEKDQLIGEMRIEIADRDRRLKLLPDLQRMAEDDRKAAELKTLEAEALRKQIAAMQSEQAETAMAQDRVHELEKALAALQSEKELQAAEIKNEVMELSKKLVEARQPWWKKVFGTPADGKTT